MNLSPRLTSPITLIITIFLLSSCSDVNEEASTIAKKHPSALTLPTPALAADSEAARKIEEKAAKVSEIKKNLGKPTPYKGELQSISKLNIRDAKLEKVVTGLSYPWAFEFINKSEILITEKDAKLIHYNLETGTKTYITGLPDIAIGFPQVGLLDVAIHPNFKNNKRIYFSFVKSDPDTAKYYLTAVATAVLRKNSLVDVEIILNGEHYGWAPSNFGGALEFDDKGYLYISIGDRGEEDLSQRGDKLEGKILRLHDDGKIPKDNPFIDDDDIDNRIYALGVRNAQGLFFDHESKQLYEAEHGPLGGDEVNIIVAGKNYGWPTISYGNNYATLKPVGISTQKEGLEQPLYYYLPSEAISPIALYRGEMFKEWNGHLLVGALRGHVSKLDTYENRVLSSRALLEEIGGRIRDVKIAHDGSIFILSQTGILFRLYRDPAQTNNSKETSSKEDLAKLRFDLICSGCHENPSSGAPLLSDKKRWAQIHSQEFEVTLKRVIGGFNNMPERGLCYMCTDGMLSDIVVYMLGASQSKQE